MTREKYKKVMKHWKVTAEINMDASDYRSVIVSANTERSAMKMAEKSFRNNGAFHIAHMSTKEIKE